MKMSWTLAVCLACAPMAAQAANPISDATLERYYQLVYGAKIEQISGPALEAELLSGLDKKQEMMACDGMREVFTAFAKEEFSPAMSRFLRSDAVSGPIKQALREHLTQADVDAYLAFADSPAGRAYMARARLADVAAEAQLEGLKETMAESPEIKMMMGALVGRMLPVAMKCQSRKK